MNKLAPVLAVAGILLVSASTSFAAEGCGPGGWRGPWGHCHFAGPPVAYRPMPAPVMTLPAVVIRPNGCPIGYWRGPWGHCRDTPYHGRLPGGGWR